MGELPFEPGPDRQGRRASFQGQGGVPPGAVDWDVAEEGALPFRACVREARIGYTGAIERESKQALAPGRHRWAWTASTLRPGSSPCWR